MGSGGAQKDKNRQAKDRDGDVKMAEESKERKEYDGTDDLVLALKCSKEINEVSYLYDFVKGHLNQSALNDASFCKFLKNHIICTLEKGQLTKMPLNAFLQLKIEDILKVRSPPHNLMTMLQACNEKIHTEAHPTTDNFV